MRSREGVLSNNPGVGKIRLFLAGKQFVLQAEQKLLSFLSTTRYKNDRILWWFLSLQGYDFVIKPISAVKARFHYERGKKHSLFVLLLFFALVSIEDQ